MPGHLPPHPKPSAVPSTEACPGRLLPVGSRPSTHLAFQWLVVGREGEDDHGAQVGDHVDVEGHSPELAPLVPQKFIDGLHGQHLVAVLRKAEAAWLPF